MNKPLTVGQVQSKVENNMLTKLAIHSSKNEMSLVSSFTQNQFLRYSKRIIQYLISVCLEEITDYQD